ncbi:MAG: hypothetical protein F4X92_07945 [Gammaproteobacteria bacterium]|nr:hypothetical protein [Gammaproteobacteria bacterium]
MDGHACRACARHCIAGLHRLRCWKVGIVTVSMPEEHSRTLVSPLSVHAGIAGMDRQGAVLHFGLELGIL